MEDCFTTIWYNNCSKCGEVPVVNSQATSVITLTILVIFETILILVLMAIAFFLHRSNKYGEFIPCEKEENVYSA